MPSGCSSSLACRACRLPESCWEEIAQAAGAVSASRLTCTASSLAAAQQYGTRERHEAEIELLRYLERHPMPPGCGYYQIAKYRQGFFVHQVWLLPAPYAWGFWLLGGYIRLANMSDINSCMSLDS